MEKIQANRILLKSAMICGYVSLMFIKDNRD